MKTLFISLVLIFSSFSVPIVQESEQVTATDVGMEDDVYYFTDTDGFSMEFHNINQEALDSFDLSDDKYKGAVFTITYISEPEIDELDEEVMVNSIIGLKMMQ